MRDKCEQDSDCGRGEVCYDYYDCNPPDRDPETCHPWVPNCSVEDGECQCIHPMGCIVEVVEGYCILADDRPC